MPKTQENLIVLKCSVCKSRNYYSRKNKKTNKEKLELNKFCKKCKKHTLHKEIKL
ncbi:50S ribosomal protein L33 [bacterium]|nr:MAG: 50S ribosomal protein L33 [bacterium]